MKVAWSLVSAAYRVACSQADLDNNVQALIDSMDDGCKLANDYPPISRRDSGSDFIVYAILREVIKGASIVKVYCEQRPKST